MIYRKLKRVWSYNNMNYIKGFREEFPELKNVDSEELSDRFARLRIDWFQEVKQEVSIWVRLTLPFALILIILMAISLPFKFMITGIWGYELGGMKLYNWFKQLRLV